VYVWANSTLTELHSHVTANSLNPSQLWVGHFEDGTALLVWMTPENTDPYRKFFNMYLPAMPATSGTYNTATNWTWAATLVVDDCTTTPNFNCAAEVPKDWTQQILSLVISPAIPTYHCTGFAAPFDKPIVLPNKGNRVIPLVAQLDNGSVPITPPIAVVIDVTTGTSVTAGSFAFDPITATWQFNLQTRSFPNQLYFVSLQSGAGTQYSVAPLCGGSFARQ
jgi:hypothetical protein